MTLEELEKRVRALEDAEEIKTLHREYLFYISNLEIDKALDCFAENITTEVAQYGIRKGKEEVGKFFREVIRIASANGYVPWISTSPKKGQLNFTPEL